VSHKLPSNSITDTTGNGGTAQKGPDSKTDSLDRKQVKAEKEVETRLVANTNDALAAGKAEVGQLQPSCR
jgi:hypothetical protein